MLKKFIICAVLLCSKLCFGNNLYLEIAIPSSDNNYYIYKTKKYHLIFDQQYIPFIDQINAKITHYIGLSEKFQKTTFSEPFAIILLSDKKQISNALATLFPVTHLQIYSSGFIGLGESSYSNWLDHAFIHELTHLFQIKHSFFPTFLKNTFKSPAGVLFGAFFFVYPNITLPMAFLEGDAILKESLTHQGGRLYSGSFRAFVYSQIKKYRNKKNKFIRKHLINMTPSPFSRKEKYLHGGYLFSALAEKFDHTTINQFFQKNSAINFVFPWSYNATLFHAFGMDINELAYFYFDRYLNQADLQRSSSKKVLFKSSVCKPFNQIGDNILFLVSNKKTPPRLKKYNIKTQTWKSRKIDLPVGKIFKIKDQYYSRATGPISPNVIKYSLFSKKRIPHPDFISKYVEDIKGSQILYIDARNTLNAFKLFLNNEFYDTVHSHSLFGPDGSIYYFKQSGESRILYKNKNALTSYKGFYGNIMDITENGAVYFTASTDFGSSIYKYENGQITRSSSSDTIIQAKKINKSEFLVCEISANNYHYKIIPEETLYSIPVFYQYSYKDPQDIHPLVDHFSSPPHSNELKKEENLLLKAQDEDLDSYFEDEESAPLDVFRNPDSLQTASSSLTYKKYNPLTYWKFGGTRVAFSASPRVWSSYIDILLTDYLQHNFLNLGYNNISFVLNKLFIQYSNRIHRLNWSLGYNYLGFHNILKDDFINEFIKNFPYTSHSVSLKFSYPLFQKGLWSSSFILLNNFKDEFLKNNHPSLHFFNIEIKDKLYHYQSLNWGGIWQLDYKRSYPLAYLPNKKLSLKVFLDYSKDLQSILDELKWGALLASTHHIGYDFYISPAFYHTSILIGGSSPISTDLYQYWNSDIQHTSYLQAKKSFDVSLLQTFKIYSTTATAAYLKLQKVFNTPIYFKVFPVSLMRLTPSVKYKYTILKKPHTFKENTAIQKLINIGPYTNWNEWSAGIESQILIYYKNPVSIGIDVGVSYQSYLMNNGVSFLNFYLKSNL